MLPPEKKEIRILSAYPEVNRVLGTVFPPFPLHHTEPGSIYVISLHVSVVCLYFKTD